MTAPPASPTQATTQIHLFEVTTLGGRKLQVQGTNERDFYVDSQKKYTTENAFTASSDFADLDRLIFLELLTFRYTSWLASGLDYLGALLGPADDLACRKVIKENAPLISSLKNDLGLTKAQRDKDQYESVGAYLKQLRARAMEHGIHRNNQQQKAIALINNLFAMLGAYDRSDEVEREKLGLENADEILEWIRDSMRPQFEALDAAYRLNQKGWVRDL